MRMHQYFTSVLVALSFASISHARVVSKTDVLTAWAYGVSSVETTLDSIAIHECKDPYALQQATLGWNWRADRLAVEFDATGTSALIRKNVQPVMDAFIERAIRSPLSDEELTAIYQEMIIQYTELTPDTLGAAAISALRAGFTLDDELGDAVVYTLPMGKKPVCNTGPCDCVSVCPRGATCTCATIVFGDPYQPGKVTSCKAPRNSCDVIVYPKRGLMNDNGVDPFEKPALGGDPS